MSFTAKIGQITGGASNNDSATVSTALVNAQHEIIAKISQFNPDMLHSMSTEETQTNNSSDLEPLDINTVVLNVTRLDSTNSITRNCTPIDRKFVEKATDADSIYYAPKTSPVYTLDKGKVYVYPAPTGSENATITKVEPGAINDNAETVANMPTSLKPLLINIASKEVIIQRLGEFTAKLPSDLNDTTAFDTISDFDDSLGITTALPSIHADYQDAVDKAQNLIDDVSQIGGDVNVDGSGTDIYSAQKWLVDEDPEMLQGTLSTASQELQRAQAVLAGYSQELNKYQAEVSKESAEAGQALQEYQANLNKKITSFTTLIGKLTTDYQWLTQQLQIITSNIAEGYALIGIKALDSQSKALGGGIAR
tara:strand:- start:2280 stop:3377 length:1098 start_codon:yes stop_codon:yes gene_type:complete